MVYEADEKERARKALSDLLRASDLDKTLDDWKDNTKCSFVTMVQFALENSTKAVLQAIGGEVSRSFSKDVDRQGLLSVSGSGLGGFWGVGPFRLLL